MSGVGRVRSIAELDLKGKKVFLRLDLNVPIGADGKIEDDTRIREALPTIRYCLDQGAKKTILCSHLGRPDGKRNPKFSLEPVAKYLAEVLAQEVLLSEDAVGDGIHQMIHHSRDNALILLENIRFYPEEEANDPGFARELARLADIYVSDAFGTAHRKHASTYGLPSISTVCAAGFLIDKELKFLTRLMEGPAHPYVLVVGGSKVTDKLKAIDHLINFVDRIVIGGAMAYAFLAAGKKEIGKSKCEAEGVAAAEQILAKAMAKKVEVFLPIDHLVCFLSNDPEMKSPEVVDNIPAHGTALDIGPRTIARFEGAIKDAKTVFWNGPMGFFEKEQFSPGTREIGQAIADSKAVKVAGGGDTLSAVAHYELSERFDLCSTGGGASLKFLEGRGLPGIDVLRGK